MNAQLVTRFAAALALSVVTCPPIAAQTSIAVVVISAVHPASVYSAGYVFPDGDPILRLLKVLPVGKGANEVCLSPAGDRAYVSNRGDISVTALDLKNLSVASTITEPEMKNPDGCIVSADGPKLYVPAAPGPTLFLFSTPLGTKPSSMKPMARTTLPVCPRE